MRIPDDDNDDVIFELLWLNTERCMCLIQTDLCHVCFVVLRSLSPLFFKSVVYQRDSLLPQKVPVLICVFIQ